jgi:hypothetical protein
MILPVRLIFQDQYENIKDKQASVDLSYLPAELIS